MAGLLQCQLAAGVAQRAGGCHREAFVGDQQGQGFGRIRIVVDDQCMGHEISGVDSQSNGGCGLSIMWKRFDAWVSDTGRSACRKG